MKEVSQPWKLGADMLVLGACEALWKKEPEQGIEKFTGSRKAGFDRLLDLDAGVVILQMENQFHRKPEQWPSELPHQFPPRHQTHKLALRPDAAVSHHLVETDVRSDRSGRSADRVEMEMGPWPPVLKGFIVAGRKKISDLTTGQACHVHAGQQ